MHTDARITLYGGVAISTAVAAVGQLAGHHTLVITGAALMGTVVAVALAFDATLADPA